MNIQREALYISDLDGTLLQGDATLSPYSRQLLNSLLQEGLPFTVASARSIVSMQPILKDVALSLPVIEFNGAFISDLATGRHEIINSFERSVAEEIYHHICAAGQVPFISTFDGSEDRLYYDAMKNEGMLWYLSERRKAQDRRLCYAPRLAQTLYQDVVCFTLIDQADALIDVQTSIQAQIDEGIEFYFYENHYSPGWYWLTMHDHRATKAQAIQTLMNTYGLDTYELIVFGDQVNDIHMFQTAHRSVAVANAIDALKQHATEITISNDDDGVMKYIEADWKKRRIYGNDNGRPPGRNIWQLIHQAG